MAEWGLKNAKLYQNGTFVQGGVVCRDGRIADAGAHVAAAQAVDLQGNYLLPGFIDVHTHGGAGIDINGANAAELAKIGAFFASQGTTSWLAGIITDTEEQTLWCIGEAKRAMAQPVAGARLLGIHMEGPFLAPAYKGAMAEHLLREGELDLFRKYQTAAEGVIRYMTVAPEVPGVPALVEEIAQDVVVSMGHSGAAYEETMDCIRRGAAAATHTGNAMKLLHQHHPAIFGAVLESDVYCEAICDGLHLHPGVVRLLLKAKGRGRVVAVTDSIMAAGLPDGTYHLGVNEVEVAGGDARLTSDGTRAGSTLTMIRALHNLVSFTGRPLEELVPLLTENPARLLGIAGEKGAIAPGYDADLVVLDSQLRVCATVVGGELVYGELS